MSQPQCTLMKGKQSKLLLCIPEWFVFLNRSWGFDSLQGESFDTNSFCFLRYSYVLKKYWLLTELFKLQTQCDTAGLS